MFRITHPRLPVELRTHVFFLNYVCEKYHSVIRSGIIDRDHMQFQDISRACRKPNMDLTAWLSRIGVNLPGGQEADPYLSYWLVERFGAGKVHSGSGCHKIWKRAETVVRTSRQNEIGGLPKQDRFAHCRRQCLRSKQPSKLEKRAC